METALRCLCLHLVSTGVDMVPLWWCLPPPPPTPRPRPATAPRLTTMKVTCKRQQPERNTCCVPPPSARQFQLLFCILPFPSFTDALLECSKFREMINNIHVMGNDVLSSAEDGPLHWSARSKSFSFHGGSDSASSDLMRIDQTQLRGKDPLCTLWHGQCVLNNYLLCFPDLKKKGKHCKTKVARASLHFCILRFFSCNYPFKGVLNHKSWPWIQFRLSEPSRPWNSTGEWAEISSSLSGIIGASNQPAVSPSINMGMTALIHLWGFWKHPSRQKKKINSWSCGT